MPAPDLQAPLAEAQAWLKGRMEAGAVCPCCGQFAKVYKRTITSSMAFALVLVYRYFRSNRGWIHVPSYLAELAKNGAAVRGGDWAKLRFWGLLAPMPTVRADGSDRAGGVLVLHDRFSGMEVDAVNACDCVAGGTQADCVAGVPVMRSQAASSSRV